MHLHVEEGFVCVTATKPEMQRLLAAAYHNLLRQQNPTQVEKLLLENINLFMSELEVKQAHETFTVEGRSA